MEEALGIGFGLLFGVFYFVFLGAMMLFALASWVLTVVAVYDCARRDFPDPGTRGLWCILIVLTQWLGALIYLLAIARPNYPPLQAVRPAVPRPPGRG